MAKVLYLYGGWPGHSPYNIAEWTRGLVGELGFDLEESQDIFTLDRDLTRYDLIVLGWNNALTTEDLSDSQEDHLLQAVESGTGVAAWHGAAPWGSRCRQGNASGCMRFACARFGPSHL